MLAGTVLDHIESGVIAPFPMQLEPQAAWLDDDDLLENGAQHALARLDRCSGMSPQTRQILGKRHQLRPLGPGDRRRLLIACGPDLLLGPRHLCEPLVPPPFELTGDQSVLRI